MGKHIINLVKISILIVLLVNSLIIFGQKIELINYNDSDYIKPTLKNLKHLYSISTSEWEKLVLENKYENISPEKGDYLIYKKGIIGECWQTISKNKTNNIVSIYWYNFETEFFILEDIENELKYYPNNKQDGITYYYYLDETNKYVFSIKRNLKEGIEELWFRE